MSEKEKKDKKMGMIVSGAIHALILALFLILVAWREPNPPLPEYGIELNFGFDDAGSGDTKSTEPAEEENTQDDPPTAMEETEDVQQDIVEEEPAEEVTEEEVVQEPDPVVVQKDPVIEKPTEDPVIEEIETQLEESEVKVEEKKEEVTEEEEVTPPPVEEKKEEVKPKPKPTVDERALMGGKKTDNNTNSASKSEGTSSDKKGNEGDPDGDVDQRGLMKGGGDGGPVLDLTGWTWNTRPKPDDVSQESGKIVFRIIIDDRGQVLRVIMEESTVSAALVRIYQKEVERVTFKPLGSNARPAPTSQGKITFVIKTN